MRQRPVDDGTATSVAVVLPLLGLFLLMPPVITLFARGVGVAGVPLIVIYVFGVWIALIVGAALLARHLDPRRPGEPADPNDAPRPDSP